MVQAMMLALIVLFTATMVVLIRKYVVTKDRGLLWLGVALVIWPLVVSPLLGYAMAYAIDGCVAGECINLLPFKFIEQGKITVGELVAIFQYVDRIVGVSFGLIAVTQLYRSVHRNGATHPRVSEADG